MAEGKATGVEQVTPVESERKDVSVIATATAPEEHAPPEETGLAEAEAARVEEIQSSKKGWFAYLKTRNFYIVLLLGQILSLSLTAQNTFSSLLAENESFSIPAFQTLFNYVLLNTVYTSYTMYRYGFKGWCKFMMKDWWKYALLSFCDVEGNYFTVLAYRYTTILSAQLINFWAIVIVVLVSSTVLRVRYHPLQIVGILICIGGVGILFGSDHITQGNSFTSTDGLPAESQVKGDLFALVGATFYGLSNITEEFLVSKRPAWEVLGQMGLWGCIYDGAMTGIFDRGSYKASNFTAAARPKIAGYMTGFTLALSLFYTLAPLVFRMASAAFFNISLLTGNFWGVVIGVKVFHLNIHWMYPIAFVCILGGLVTYFIGKSVLGEALKPWLGRRQEKGVDGLGTARRRVERGDELIV